MNNHGLFISLLVLVALASNAAIKLQYCLFMCAHYARLGYWMRIFTFTRCREIVHHAGGAAFVWAEVLALSSRVI